MTYLEATSLGALQGFTEFLPVSSSGHLVIAQSAMGLQNGGIGASLSFEVITHLGTLLAVFVYFRGLIGRLFMSLFDKSMAEERRLVMYVVIGTLPAVAVGLGLKPLIEGAFASVTAASVALLINGVILLSTRFAGRGSASVGPPSALAIGFAQACALMPGISRSGSTISMGMFLNISPEKAAQFSFLLAIPAILGAAVLDFGDLQALNGEQLGTHLTGAAVSFVCGLLAVSWLMKLIRQGKFTYFGIYCLIVGAGALMFL